MNAQLNGYYLTQTDFYHFAHFALRKQIFIAHFASRRQIFIISLIF